MHERPSDRCVCSTRRHVRMHGSHARKEHAVTIAGSSVPAVSDAQDDNTLDPRRSGAAQVARDAPLQPDARVERSERWLLCAANDGIRGAWERCAPTHLRLPQDPWRCSAPPRCAGRGYSWRSCVMVGTSRGQRGGWTGAAGVLRRACGACCGTVAVLLQHRASAASALHKAAAGRARTGAAVGALGSTWLSSAGLWRQQQHHLQSSLHGRTRQLGVHVAD